MSVSIALLLLADLAQDSQPTQAPSSEEAIVILGERLGTWRGRVNEREGRLRCVTTRSSGDTEVDAIGCEAMLACFTPLRPRMVAAAERPRRERRPLLTAIEQELGTCMIERRDSLIADLADRRYGARTEGGHAQD